MGEATLHSAARELVITSILYLYGDAADATIAAQVANDISKHWNEPQSKVKIRNEWYTVRFQIEGIYEPQLKPETVWYNDDPRLNFFRIEEFAMGNISFVDGLGSNTGYFKRDNLLQTSTTAAHEYGHTLGLEHPDVLDIRGQDIPGIMYPRGTICDPMFQYDPQAPAGQTGGTLNPLHRRVLQSDIDDLRLHRLSFDERGSAIVGGFSSLYHAKHKM